MVRARRMRVKCPRLMVLVRRGVKCSRLMEISKRIVAVSVGPTGCENYARLESRMGSSTANLGGCPRHSARQVRAATGTPGSGVPPQITAVADAGAPFNDESARTSSKVEDKMPRGLKERRPRCGGVAPGTHFYKILQNMGQK